MAHFGKISSIVPENRNSWENILFLTIDIDWASDAVLEHTLDMLEAAGATATIFVTHDTPVLARLRGNPRVELGIHPNFNPLLAGQLTHGANAGAVVSSLLSIVPEARCVRSHSTTQSSGLLELFRQSGLTHDCNHFVPAVSDMQLKPYRLWNELVKAPYFWEDDVDLLYRHPPDISSLVRWSGLKVFNFHPIHIALNSTSIDVYEKSRAVHRNWASLQEYVCHGRGVKTAFEDLLGLVNRRTP